MTRPAALLEAEQLLSQATPGPWRVGEKRTYGIFADAYGDNSIRPWSLATVSHFEGEMRPDTEVDAANAHLIAAAPRLIADLAAALRESEKREAELRADARAAYEREIQASIPPEVAQLVVSVGMVEHSHTEPQTPEAHAADMLNSVLLTREHHQQGDGPQSMQFLTLEGADMVLACVGTSPRSAAIASALGGAWNMLLYHCRAALGQAQPEQETP